jgi:hypothetical protein
MTMFVTVVASIVWAVATPQPAGAAVGGGVLKAPGGACSTEEWQQDFKACVSRLASGASRAHCLTPPTPSTPDSGLAGGSWKGRVIDDNSFPGLRQRLWDMLAIATTDIRSR